MDRKTVWIYKRLKKRSPSLWARYYCPPYGSVIWDSSFSGLAVIPYIFDKEIHISLSIPIAPHYTVCYYTLKPISFYTSDSNSDMYRNRSMTSSAQRSYLNDHMCISDSHGTAGNSQETSTPEYLQSLNGPSNATELAVYPHSHFGGLESLSRCGSLPTTTPQSSPPLYATRADIANRNSEQNEQWIIVGCERYPYPQSQISSRISSEESQFKFTDARLSNSVEMHEYDQHSPSTTRTTGASNGRGDIITAQTVTDEPQSIPFAPVNPNPSRPRRRPTPSRNPYAFQKLPSYHGERNYEGLLDCFEGCHRLGRLGIERRGNLLVHLRNCHAQKISKFDHEESQKIRVRRKNMLSTGICEQQTAI